MLEAVGVFAKPPKLSTEDNLNILSNVLAPGTILPYNNISWLSKRSIRINIHALWQVAALTCACIGFSAIYINKNQNNKPHFVTWHGLCGLLTLVLTMLNFTGGLITKYYFSIAHFITKSKNINKFYSLLKTFHALTVLSIFSFHCITVYLIYYSNWIKQYQNTLVPYVFAIVPLTFALIFILGYGVNYLNNRIFNKNNNLISSVKTMLKQDS
ncbi:unnamed protein product [Gordionus sp. m RMFG-2023]